MCTSIKDGGRRCKKHEATIAKNKLKKAKESGDAAAIKEATVEYLSTEEGVEQLEDQGRLELADRFRSLRNKKIQLHNAHWGTNHKLMAPRAVRRAPAYNMAGYDAKTKLHRDTGTAYNPKGYDIDGNHKDTHTKFGPDGFNIVGVDADGYSKDGFKNGYSRQGFSKQGWDKDGYLPNGFHHKTMLDRDGYDAQGWSRFAIHRDTGLRYDPEGYDRDGYHHETHASKESGMTVLEEINARHRSQPQSPVRA